MYKQKRIIGIVPARSGSKGLPDKNILPFCGKPLLAHTVETALRAEMLDAVLVSTDSIQYAEIAKRYGAIVPFLRPEELARDNSLASEYIVHALLALRNRGEAYDYFVLLQPTSPLRTERHIRQGIQMAVDEDLSAVVAFSEAPHPLQYYAMLPEDMRLGGLAAMKERNRQQTGQYYRVNGMLYVCSCAFYLENRTFYGANGKAILFDERDAIDIDTAYDFELAELIYQHRERQKA